MISFQEFSKLDNDDIKDLIIELFELENYIDINSIISMIEFTNIDLLKDFTILYYVLFTLIKLNEIEKALSVIKESKIVEENKDYFEDDGANFSNLLKEDIDTEKAIIMASFVKRFIDVGESLEDMSISYFELVSILYELGYSNELINDLNNKGNKIFNI